MEAVQAYFKFDPEPISIGTGSVTILSVMDVAGILKIRPESVRAEINAGRLAASRVGPKGGVMRIRLEWLIEYLESQKIFAEK